MSKTKFFNWFILSSITLGLIIGLIALVELYCSYSYYKYRDSLKNELKAIRLRQPFCNQVSDNFKTDSLGFILPYTSLDSSSKTVVFLGGSTTECYKVKDNKRIHVSVEEQLSKVSCLNIGNSGNHSMHSLNLLTNKVLSLSPDVLVINHNVNDLSILLNTGTYFNKHPQRSLLLDNTEQLYAYKVGYPKNWFVRKYIPYTSLVLFPTTFEGEDLIKNQEFSTDPLRDDFNIDSLKNIFRKSLLGLVNYAKSWDVKPILMTQGSCFEEYGYSLKNIERYDGYNLDSLHKEFNKVVRDVAIISNVSLVDAEKLMEDKKECFYDVVHYTDSGSVFISNYIASEIKRVLN